MHWLALLPSVLLSAMASASAGALRRRKSTDVTSYAPTIDTNDARLFVDSESHVGNIRRNLYEHRFEIPPPSSNNNDNEEEVLLVEHTWALTDDITTSLDDDDISTYYSPTVSPTYTVVGSLDDDLFSTLDDDVSNYYSPTEAPTYAVVGSLDDDITTLDDDNNISTYYFPTASPEHNSTALESPTQSPSYMPTSHYPTYSPTNFPSYAPVYQGDTNGTNFTRDNLHVNRMYTYGAPSIIKSQSSSILVDNNNCIPGLRIYNQDETITKCHWYDIRCKQKNIVTNVDFASQINNKEGYHHPNMDVLIVRLVDGNKIEYTLRYCSRQMIVNTNQTTHDIEPYQTWPKPNLDSSILNNNHYIPNHYEPRLRHIPSSVRGHALEYTSVAQCLYESYSYESIQNCIKMYNTQTPSRLNGVYENGWMPFAYMKQEESLMSNGILGMIMNDVDQVYVLKNDNVHDNNDDDDTTNNRRKCIIAFQGSSSITDLLNFVSTTNKGTTSYCGIDGIHNGVANELSKLIHNRQYTTIIKPALETCHDVTCVGHSLGGSLCNLFTLCANQKVESIDANDLDGWREYQTLIWDKRGDEKDNDSLGPSLMPSESPPFSTPSSSQAPSVVISAHPTAYPSSQEVEGDDDDDDDDDIYTALYGDEDNKEESSSATKVVDV